MLQLTPADIMDLRASVRWHLNTVVAKDVPVPFICYARTDRSAMNAPGYSDEAFALYAEGHLWAVSTRIEILTACLRCEYAEPGFMRRVMDPREDCALASLSPDVANAERSRRAFEAKAIREQLDEREREKQRQREASAKRRDPNFDPKQFQLKLD